MSTPGTFDLAVFPLLDAVLFPGTTLPIQVYEERFDRMMQDVQARGWPLAISWVTPAENSEIRLSSICGAGTIQIFREIEAGKYEVHVHGNRRVRLLSVIQQVPYLIMEAEEISSPEHTGIAFQESFDQFQALVKAWIFMNPAIPDELTLLFQEFTGFGELTDFFVFHFIRKPEEKQQYLSCVNPLRRAEMLAQYLRSDLNRLNRKVGRAKRSLSLH